MTGSVPIQVILCQGEPDTSTPRRESNRAEPCDHCGLMTLRGQSFCYMTNSGSCTTPPRMEVSA